MEESIVRVENLSHEFKIDKTKNIRALSNISFEVKKGEILGIVGESGCGKSTLVSCMMNIIQPTKGKIFYKDIEITDPGKFGQNRKVLQRERQIIFQDSSSSLNPHMKVVDIIGEPLKIHHRKTPRGSIRQEAAFQMKYVGLSEELLDCYPYQLSGGQRQRIAIARALCMEPDLLVADEPTASLDVTTRAQIVSLFKHLKEEHGFSICLVAHDLSMVRNLCDRVAVMYRGELVELAPATELFSHPEHAYTKKLLEAMLTIE